ncbi:hypothetical protein Esti_002186 [Eimeria stiedai]
MSFNRQRAYWWEVKRLLKVCIESCGARFTVSPACETSPRRFAQDRGPRPQGYLRKWRGFHRAEFLQQLIEGLLSHRYNLVPTHSPSPFSFLALKTTMGAVTSRCEGPWTRACRRLRRLWDTSYWLSSNITWMGATAAICLVAPVIFYYERECQMFEMQQQFMEAQQAAAQAQHIQQISGGP